MGNEDSYPLEEGLFTTGDTPQLIGARCAECEGYFFPSFAEYHRPNCSGGPVEKVLLSRTGVLSSWTIQHYPPPPPYPQLTPHVPFPLGTVALPEGLQIPAQLTGFETDDLRIGTPVEMVTDAIFVGEDSRRALTWKFRPLTRTP